MSYCKNCGIEIVDDASVCPLCGFALERAHDNENMYPDITKIDKKISLAARIFLTVAIIVTFFSAVANYFLTPDVLWCLVVAGGLVLTFMILKILVEYEYGYQLKTFTMVFAAYLYLLLIDAVFGFQRWSLNYVFPAMILAIDVVVLVLMIVNFRNWQSYLTWLIFMIALAIVAVVLSYFGIITRPILSGIALTVTVFFFLGTVIIGGGRAKAELQRRFHVS